MDLAWASDWAALMWDRRTRKGACWREVGGGSVVVVVVEEEGREGEGGEVRAMPRVQMSWASGRRWRARRARAER